MEEYNITTERDPEYHKLADAFLEAARNSKNIEFVLVSGNGDAFVHKNGKWRKLPKFNFYTPQIK